MKTISGHLPLVLAVLFVAPLHGTAQGAADSARVLASALSHARTLPPTAEGPIGLDLGSTVSEEAAAQVAETIEALRTVRDRAADCSVTEGELAASRPVYCALERGEVSMVLSVPRLDVDEDSAEVLVNISWLHITEGSETKRPKGWQVLIALEQDGLEWKVVDTRLIFT